MIFECNECDKIFSSDSWGNCPNCMSEDLECRNEEQCEIKFVNAVTEEKQ